MQTRRLGANGPEVSAIGLGCMALSGGYGPADDEEGIAVIQAALDAGISMVDTGDFYGMGHNEMLVGEALRGRRDQAFIAVKFGALRDPSGAFIGFDARPTHMKHALGQTLRKLRTDHIDLYMPARIDRALPIEDVVGAIGDMVKAGYVRHIGLSEASIATIKRAQQTHPIAALQIEYSVIERGVEEEVLPGLAELGVGMTAYGVMSRGLLNPQLTAAGSRAHFPRFSPGNFEANKKAVAAFAAIAADKGATPAQLAFAWVLSRRDFITPLAGARTRAQLTDVLGALEITLNQEDFDRIDTALPPEAIAGARYGEQHAAQLNG